MKRISTTTAGDYDKSFDEHGESPKALLWANYKVPAIRFKELATDLPIDGKTILDVGCGMGDLLPFLYSKSTNFRYQGMDINEEFIKIAQKRYEGHDFKVADPLTEDVGRFDIVICSGMLNGNVDNWMEKRQAAIARLFSLANEALAFNMAGGFQKITDTPITAFADADKIMSYCVELTPRVILRAHYSGRGFTILMFK